MDYQIERNTEKMKRVFVSGCFDIIHAGHIQFFRDAKNLGDHLTVCFASDKAYKLAKGRQPSMPEDNKAEIIGAIRWVDGVVKSKKADPVWDFEPYIKGGAYDILAVTDDDKNIEQKRLLCEQCGAKLVVLGKKNHCTQVSTTKIMQGIKGKSQVPLRVDFAGGWLDVPRFCRPGGFIVNCAISPLVSLDNWPYKIGSGLGGSAAKAILEMRDGVRSEIDFGVGWQDPAIIEETGLCVWLSGRNPMLHIKIDPILLTGKMAIRYTGKEHDNINIVNNNREYTQILAASQTAARAVMHNDYSLLCQAIHSSYSIQIAEGMHELSNFTEIAKKYCGGGWGGYALYMFRNYHERQTAVNSYGMIPIEPYIKNYKGY